MNEQNIALAQVANRNIQPWTPTLEEAERIVAQPGWKPSVQTEVREQPRPLVPEW